MAAKTSWHRYGKKLRHCHPMYIVCFYSPIIGRIEARANSCWASYLGSQHDATRSCSSGACRYRSTGTGCAGGRYGSKGNCCRRDRQTDWRTPDRNASPVFRFQKNVTFYFFLKWRQKVVRKSLVLNPWKWVHTLCSVITQFSLPECDPFWLGYEANIARCLMLVAYRYWLSVIVY